MVTPVGWMSSTGIYGMLRLLGGAEQSFVVAATVEDADYRYRVVEDGECDEYAFAVTDGS